MLTKLLKDGKKQFIVSLTCALLIQAMIFLGDYFGFGYIAVFVAVYFIVVIVGYSLLCFLHETVMSIGGVVKYFLGMSMNFPVCLLIMYIAVDMLGLHPLYGSVSGMLVLFLYNYKIGKWSIL